MRTLPRGIYCIAGDRDTLRLVEAFVEGGAAVVQLRLKQASARELLRLAREAKAICAGRAALLINDRPDVARLAEVDGVHLGQDDLPVREARKLLGPDALIGLSTHSDEELRTAEGVDYVGFGPIFGTRSKPGAVLPDPHGIEGLSRAVERASVPVVAIGGITLATAGQIAKAGAHCAALIAEVCDAPDPAARVRELVEAFRG